MSRPTTIAAVAVATGVLLAASVASVAAISASASSQELPSVDSPVASVSTTASNTAGATVLPEVGSDADLIVPTVSTPGTATQVGAAAGTTSMDAGASRNGRTGGTKPSTASGIRSTQAKAAVVRVSPGRVLDVSHAQHGGYASYAVTVERADGSVVTGYVDRASGVVFDWAKVSGPTVSSSGAGSTSGASTSDGDDDARESSDEASDDSEDESADHDSADHESDDHESDDESHDSDD